MEKGGGYLPARFCMPIERIPTLDKFVNLAQLHFLLGDTEDCLGDHHGIAVLRFNFLARVEGKIDFTVIGIVGAVGRRQDTWTLDDSDALGIRHGRWGRRRPSLNRRSLCGGGREWEREVILSCVDLKEGGPC